MQAFQTNQCYIPEKYEIKSNHRDVKKIRACGDSENPSLKNITR